MLWFVAGILVGSGVTVIAMSLLMIAKEGD